MLSLKEATSAKHSLAEKMPFNLKMFRGLLSKEAYLMYLYQQLAIFKAIEQVGVPSDSLKREVAVLADISELEAEGISSVKTLPSTIQYETYLKSLSSEGILPHVYLNYLALVFGGQMIKKNVPSSGKMYEFDNKNEAIMAVRQLQKDAWADEANKGFVYLIAIFEELEAHNKA